MATVDQALWPLLVAAAEAEAASTTEGAAGEAALGGALGRAARGVGAWREALSRGRLWEDVDGADWPAQPSLREQWTGLLSDLEMPRFTRKYPQLLDPLMASLLETVERFSSEEEQEEQQQEPEGSEGDNQEEEEQEGEGQVAAQDPSGAPVEGNEGEEEASAARAAELMEELREQWEGTTQALKEADETFGPSGGSAVADGVGAGGESPWQETEAWQEFAKLRALLSQNPEVRELVRNLGRRSAVKGPLRRLPEELSRESSPQGVVRSRAAPAEANGVCLAGEWDSMLPSEAQLLASKRPMLRSLHHARRIERALLSYDRTAWLEEEARETGRMELRPFGKAGPLIVCLDTSGSMQGPRETLGKALVLECLRQAHKQKRRCYLYAFSGAGQLQELELSLSAQGLQQLLDFLKFSFCGGTSLDAALEASTTRLSADDCWRNADILIVTDGELPEPADAVAAELEAARAGCGTRVVGLVLGDEAGSVMEDLCSDLYLTGQPEAGRRGTLSPGPSWGQAKSPAGRTGGRRPGQAWPRLRKVQLQRERATVAAAAAGVSPRPSLPTCRWGGTAANLSPWGQGAQVGRHLAARPAAARSRSPQRGGRAEGASAKPDYTRFSDGLVLVIKASETEARRLRQRTLGTESLLLGLLGAPEASELMSVVFPDGIASVPAARAIIEEKLLGPASSSSAGGSRRSAAGPPLAFTPMAQRALLAAQGEQERLGHKTVEPAHLLLGLLQDERGDACEMLAEFEADMDTVRTRVLSTLSGPLARVRLATAQQLRQLRSSALEATAPGLRQGGPQREALAKRLAEAHSILTQGLVERSVEAKLLLLAALSGEHLFLLGPPGTAKSLLARRLSCVCQGSFFERLLTRFSVPEEVFGPLSLKALENDELRRKVDGFLPDADVAFLDEVFKANSSILNALLALLNERVFDNGGSRMEVPLWCAVAASNELPESDELDALFDRFLLRRAVPRVSDEAVPGFLRATLKSAVVEDAADEPAADSPAAPLLTAVESAELRKEASESVEFPDRLLEMVAALRAHLRDEAEPPVLVSDRRLAKAVRLLRVAAYAAGGTEVSELDLLLLQYVFWDREPQQALAVRDFLLARFAGAGGEQEEDCIPQARFLLAGMRKRLARRPLKPAVAMAVQRDLEGLRAPLEDQLRARLAKQALLSSLLEGNGLGGGRLFWLEETELEEAAAQLLPRAEKASTEAEDALREVLEILEALAIPKADQRDACLEGLLQSEAEASAGARRADVSKESLNKWASSFKLPSDGVPFKGSF